MATSYYTEAKEQITTYNQPTATPVAKVKAVGWAGLATTVVPLVVTLLAAIGIDAGNPETVTNQVVALIGAIVTIYTLVSSVIQFLAGYFKKSDTANGVPTGATTSSNGIAF